MILEGGHYRCTTTDWHGHGERSAAVKLYAPTTGCAWVALAGRRSELRAGALYLIPPHQQLHYGTATGMTVDWLHFMPLSPLVDARLATLGEVQCLPADYPPRWRSVTRALAQYFQRPTPPLGYRVQALVLDVVGSILDGMPAEKEGTERLLPALQFMDDHVMTAPPLAAIARTVKLSPEHFHRLFRQQFHTTPFAYLLRRRLAHARHLLAEGVLSVKEVAAACGYDDPYYFSRVFHQRQGCTPRAVRLGKACALP